MGATFGNRWYKHASLVIHGLLRYPVCNNSMWVSSGKFTDSGGLDTCLLCNLVCTLI